MLFYAYDFFAYSQNIPILDDYDAVSGGLIQFADAGSLRERLPVFFMQHNEHRVVVPKLFIFADYYIGGAANFRTLIFPGNLMHGRAPEPVPAPALLTRRAKEHTGDSQSK